MSCGLRHLETIVSKCRRPQDIPDAKWCGGGKGLALPSEAVGDEKKRRDARYFQFRGEGARIVSIKESWQYDR